MSETVIQSFHRALSHLYDIGFGDRPPGQDQKLFDIAVATAYSGVDDTVANRKALFDDLPPYVKSNYGQEDYELLMISLRAFYEADLLPDEPLQPDGFPIGRPGNTLESSAKWAREFLYDVMVKESDTTARIAGNYGAVRQAVDGRADAVKPQLGSAPPTVSMG